MTTPASVLTAILISTVSYLRKQLKIHFFSFSQFYCRINLSIQTLLVSGRFLQANAAAFTTKSLTVRPRGFSFESLLFGANISFNF